MTNRELASLNFDAAKQLARKFVVQGRRPRFTICYALMALKTALRLREESP